MKKKFISLLMVFVLALSSVMVVSAEEQLERPQEWAEALGLTEMSGADAISHVEKAVKGEENSVFLDLRAKEDFAAGHLKNTVSAPVCNADFSVPVSNRDAFIAQMAELKVTEYDTIYLSCYAGTFCVDYAADWLINHCGAKAEQLVRVTGGTYGDADLTANSVFVSTTYALAQVEAGKGFILDVRAEDDYFADGYLDGSINVPLFKYVDGTRKVTDRQDDLAQNFLAFVKANKALFDNKDVYVLCNSGASGAAAAMALLSGAGYSVMAKDSNDNGSVFSIEGGKAQMFADHPELVVNQQFVSGKEAVAITGTATTPSATDANAVVIDVRAIEKYDVGHLKSVPSYPLFTYDAANDKNVVSNRADKLAADFLAKVEANAEYFAGKDIYIVCNSGASGARAATRLLMQAGYSNDVIYTVTGGAKGTEEDPSVPQNSKFVSPAQAYRAQADLAYWIIDVRAFERYVAGTLEGAVSVPLFTVDAEGNNVPVQPPYEDELSMAFKQYVEENKDLLATKTIYILCNSGESGARNATVLLNEAGLVDNVFTIDGGAKALVFDAPEADDPEVDDPEVDEPETDEPEADKPEIEIVDKEDEADAPKTGDTTPIMGYVLVMCAALAVIVNRKRFTK